MGTRSAKTSYVLFYACVWNIGVLLEQRRYDKVRRCRQSTETPTNIRVDVLSGFYYCPLMIPYLKNMTRFLWLRRPQAFCELRANENKGSTSHAHTHTRQHQQQQSQFLPTRQIWFRIQSTSQRHPMMKKSRLLHDTKHISCSKASPGYENCKEKSLSRPN